jgi:DNA-binding beta-propeller fold protein YncE
MLRAMKRLARALGLAALVAAGAGCGDGDPSERDADAHDAASDAAASDATPGDARDAGDARADTPTPKVGPPNACVPGAGWFDLPYTVASAAWSRALNLVVLRPETEHAIYLMNPDTCAAARIAVPRLPSAVAVSPSGTEVAVGHDGLVSIVDLARGDVRAAIGIPAPATELAYDDAGRVLVFSRALAAISTQLLVVDPAARTVTAAGALDGAGHLRATPDGSGVFWTDDDQTAADATARVIVGRSPLTDASATTTPSCHDLFPTDDGHRLVTACGTVLDLAPDGGHDLLAAGSLAGVARVLHADSLVEKGVVAVMPASAPDTSPPADGSVRIYRTRDLSFVGTLPLPILDTGFEHQTPHGRYVFLRADGARAYVLARRQPGQAPVDGIAVLDPAGAGLEAPEMLSVSSSFPHRDGLPMPATPTRTAVTVPFRVTGAAYSRALGRLVMSSDRPFDAVYLVDPATGASTKLAEPAGPGAVTLREDGLVAAVARTGGVTFIDLQSRSIVREVDGPATSVAFGKIPEVLIAADGSTSSWLDLDTGARRAASTTTEQTPGFSTVPGTNVFYSLRAHTLVRHDDVIAAGDPAFDLAPFVSPEAIVRPCATPFWITEDGSHLVLDCARVFALSPDRAGDLRYVGILEWESATAEVAYSRQTHRFFSVPSVFDLGEMLATGIGRIAVHDDVLLNLTAVIDLGLFPGTAELSQPEHLFLGQKPGELIVVVQADTFTTPSHAVYTFDVTGL